MSDLEEVIDLRTTEPKAVTRSCLNCGNYQTCTVRVAMPQTAVEMENDRPFSLPEGFVTPMACGGSLWREVEASDALLIVKQPDETWAKFYSRKASAKSNPQLTELP